MVKYVHTHRFVLAELCTRMTHAALSAVFEPFGLATADRTKIRGQFIPFLYVHEIIMCAHNLLLLFCALTTEWRSAGKSLTLRMTRKEHCEFLREGEHTMESATLKTKTKIASVATETETSVITKVKDYYYKVRCLLTANVPASTVCVRDQDVLVSFDNRARSLINYSPPCLHESPPCS